MSLILYVMLGSAYMAIFKSQFRSSDLQRSSVLLSQDSLSNNLHESFLMFSRFSTPLHWIWIVELDTIFSKV